MARATMEATAPQSAWSRLRRAALGALFAAVLLIPRTLGLRRRTRVWNRARLVVALLAAALLAAAVVGPARAHAPLWVGALGAVLLILAALVPPERPRLSVDARARELGAFIVVRSGSFRAPGASTAPSAPLTPDTRLAVGPERLVVLDTALRALAEIPLAQLTTLRAAPEGAAWKLQLIWSDSTADFLFEGPFAEHFARVAESTVRSLIPNPLPILH